VHSWSKIARRIRVPLGFVFAVLYVWLAKPTAISLLLGAVVVIPGLLLRALASGHVRKNEELATTGPYAYVRNPLYLGSLIMAVGFACAARSWWIAGIAVVFFFAIYIPVIRGEENYLGSRFTEFAGYVRSVPSMLPRVTPYSKVKGAMSWKLYWKHREYNALLGALAIIAILAGKLLYLNR
jgi:protein-S-isoprenylcysteine O-methyltransferase Ste14